MFPNETRNNPPTLTNQKRHPKTKSPHLHHLAFLIVVDVPDPPAAGARARRARDAAGPVVAVAALLVVGIPGLVGLEGFGLQFFLIQASNLLNFHFSQPILYHSFHIPGY